MLPVDHPLVRPQTITTLFETRAKAAIPSFKGKHGHPVCVRRPVVGQILDASLSGPTLRDVLRSVQAVDVPVDDPGVTANCNTPHALAKALEETRGGSIES